MKAVGLRGMGAGVVLIGTLAVGQVQEITTLTIQEQVGVARANEPVRMGVPLARGIAREVTELALTDAAGQAIPCQFREVMRWPEDNSLRWVHVVFQTSVPAKGTAVARLVKGRPAESKSKVVVERTGEAVAVKNGLLKLLVKGPGFNLFDTVWYDPTGSFGPGTEIVKSHNEGFVALIDGQPYKPGADSKVEVEEQGSECAVLRVSGRMATANGQGPFEYVCYIHVFAGSPVVRISFSYTNVSGNDPADHVALKDLSLVLPTVWKSGSARIGGEERVFTGRSGKIFAKTSDLSEIMLNGTVAGRAAGKSTKPKTIGWADLSSGDRGVGVGVRWFWQMFPKVVEVTEDGKLRVALYAAESGTPLDVYMGQGRTHYLTFIFHGEIKDEELMNFFAGTQMPLRALAPPRYYCRESEGFGKVVESDPALFDPDVADRMVKFDEAVKKSAEYIEKKIDGCTYQGVTLDSYGYLAWGDVFHWANTPGVTNVWNILWESNYYDYPWTCCLQFARTGDPMYLDILDRHGLHLADVFMCKWHPDPKLRGACRYSPPANHVGLDVDYKTPKPYVSVEFNHHKAQSILARYYLLGDLRARDDFLLALNNAMTNPEASWRQCRGPGAKLATLYSGYILTRNPECLQKMKECMAGAIKLKDNPTGFSRQGKSGYFMMGIATEGMYYYWLLTGDKDTLETIRSVSDFLLGEGRSGASPNAACGVALLYHLTGEEKYKQGALGFLKASLEQRPKGFAQSWRNSAYAWYYLSKVAKQGQ